MKTLPAGLQAHLDSGATTLAWCWRITRADGAVFGFTDHDRPLAFAGTDFEPDSGFNASRNPRAARSCRSMPRTRKARCAPTASPRPISSTAAGTTPRSRSGG